MVTLDTDKVLAMSQTDFERYMNEMILKEPDVFLFIVALEVELLNLIHQGSPESLIMDLYINKFEYLETKLNDSATAYRNYYLNIREQE